MVNHAIYGDCMMRDYSKLVAIDAITLARMARINWQNI